MVTKIKQIFKQAVLRFWSLRVPLIVVCILLAALLCTAQYQDSSRVASAQMTLNYSEASQGLNPNRTRFTTTDLTSDEVLQSTLYNAGLEGQMTVEQLRKAITVEPTDVTNVSSSKNYITTSCSISLQLEEPCQHLTAATLLRIFCGSYKDYFMEHYGENQSVFSCFSCPFTGSTCTVWWASRKSSTAISCVPRARPPRATTRSGWPITFTSRMRWRLWQRAGD